MEDETSLSWSFQNLWNDSLAIREEPREFKARSYCYASELGGAMVDRYLKMTGVPASNPPNSRSFRKFDAGDMWEGICRFILSRAGLIIGRQESLEFQYPELLPVHGRLDFFAGGKPDWNEARKSAEDIEVLFGKLLDERLGTRWKLRTLYIINKLEEKYGETPLKEIVLEIKSCSTFMYDKYEATNKPNPHHVLQAFHYILAKGISEAHIVYICKDDCRVIEFGVFNPSPVEEFYKQDIAEITEYYRKQEMPELESQILFDTETGKFSTNWKVEYSNYLTALYNYATPKEYREAWELKVAQMNRTMLRVVEEKKMTDKNLEAIEMAKLYFPNWVKLVEIAKSLKTKIIEEDFDIKG